jgi:hypothetical protein
MSGGNDKFLCNTDNENCMYGVRTSCPSAETLEVLLHNELDDMTTEYKHWVMTDRATLFCNTAVWQTHWKSCVWNTWTDSSSLYYQTTCQIFEIMKRKSSIRPMHNFGRLLRELFICTPRYQTGFSLGKQSSSSSSFHCSYQRSTPANFVLLCNCWLTLIKIHYHFLHFRGQ